MLENAVGHKMGDYLSGRGLIDNGFQIKEAFVAETQIAFEIGPWAKDQVPDHLVVDLPMFEQLRYEQETDLFGREFSVRPMIGRVREDRSPDRLTAKQHRQAE